MPKILRQFLYTGENIQDPDQSSWAIAPIRISPITNQEISPADRQYKDRSLRRHLIPNPVLS